MATEQAAIASAAPPRALPFRRRRWLTVGVGALAAAAALVVAIRVARPAWLGFGPAVDRPELQELVAALANEPTRPVEGRLTGGFKYAPPPSPVRGASDRSASPAVQIAVAELERIAKDQPSPDTEAALGFANLVLGDTERAVSHLEAATASRPSTASFHTDLAAALIARGTRRSRDEDYSRALVESEAALRFQPGMVEALFNRALALERLGRTEDADAAWRAYFRNEPNDAWREGVLEHERKDTPRR